MTYTSRPYQFEKVLHDIGRLIRRTYAKRKYLNAWSFCHYDIWAQRRVADAVSLDDDLWQKNFKLVYDALLGAAFAFNNHHWRNDPEPYALILDPEHVHLAELFLDWAESSGMREIEMIQGNTFLTELIQSRGYK